LGDLEFVSLDADVAKIYHERFHYIGSSRPGHHFAFQDRNSGRIVCVGSVASFDLKHAEQKIAPHVDPRSVLMLSRFFAFRWAPQNTFSHFHGKLRLQLMKEFDTKLMFSFINPNVGFNGSSHKGAHWMPFALEEGAQYMYLDARAQARDKRVVIEATFGRHFVELFNKKVRGDDTPVAAVARLGELALVNEEDLEETLAMREMSSKLKASCEGELMALSQRMGFLLERPGLEDDANPMSPAAICAALQDACNQIEAGQKVRMALLRQLESYAEGEVQRIYHDLNSHLVERRILPDVRPGVPRAVIAPAPRRAPKKAGSAGTAQGQGQSQPAGPVADGDILAALAQLLGGRAAPAQGSGSDRYGGVPAGGAPAAIASWPTAPGSASAAPTVPSSFVSELTRMHREPGSTPMENGALMNVVRRIKAAPQSATLGTVDAMTIAARAQRLKILTVAYRMICPPDQ